MNGNKSQNNYDELIAASNLEDFLDLQNAIKNNIVSGMNKTIYLSIESSRTMLNFI